VKLILVVVGAA